MHDNMIFVNQFSPVTDAQLIFGGIVQLHDVAFRCIEDSFETMILIAVLLAEIGTLLAGNSLPKRFLGLSRERSFQRVKGIQFESLGDAGPGEAIITKDAAFG